MNPMQLLTVSKSLMGIKDATGRYRMVEGNLLPKFNSTVRAVPPAPMAKADPARLATRPSIEDQPIAKLEVKSKKLPVAPVQIRVREIIFESGRVALAVCSKACSSVASVREKIKPLSYWKGRQTRGKTEKIKPIKPAVQGELSLDQVKVMRNDLSDTDLEIVPVTNPKQPKMSGAVPVLVSESEPTRTSWGRLTSRVFGIGQTPF